MKHTPMRRKPKRNPTPVDVYKTVCLRSGGKWISGECYGGHCEECKDTKRDWRGLMFHHQKNRKMGGTNSPEIHSAKFIRRLCGFCHDKEHGIIDKPT